MAKFAPHGPTITEGEFFAREERSVSTGRSRFRVARENRSLDVLVDADDLFALTNVLNGLCDDVEDRGWNE